jgi:heat shock protein HslJ
MKNAKKSFILLFFLLAAGVFSGCASKEEPAIEPDFPLAGTHWAPLTGPQGAVLEFSPDAKRIVGTTNGNRFFAPVERARGELLNFGNIAITRAISRDPEREAMFIDALDRTRAWKISDNTLVLEDERKKTVLRLQRLYLKKRKAK